ncbi:Transposase B [Yersinia intermedia ATCC 29909]|jgi:hypothetical protein|nr:Transposase B [Yersinia intermedia ATCC 29909]
MGQSTTINSGTDFNGQIGLIQGIQSTKAGHGFRHIAVVGVHIHPAAYFPADNAAFSDYKKCQYNQ